jgi:hypothetical protein
MTRKVQSQSPHTGNGVGLYRDDPAKTSFEADK